VFGPVNTNSCRIGRKVNMRIIVTIAVGRLTQLTKLPIRAPPRNNLPNRQRRERAKRLLQIDSSAWCSRSFLTSSRPRRTADLACCTAVDLSPSVTRRLSGLRRRGRGAGAQRAGRRRPPRRRGGRRRARPMSAGLRTTLRGCAVLSGPGCTAARLSVPQPERQAAPGPSGAGGRGWRCGAARRLSLTIRSASSCLASASASSWSTR